MPSADCLCLIYDKKCHLCYQDFLEAMYGSLKDGIFFLGNLIYTDFDGLILAYVQITTPRDSIA